MHSKAATRPKLFVGHTEVSTTIQHTPVGSLEDNLQSCPEAVLVWDVDDADYQLEMKWGKDHWASALTRKDYAFLFSENNPDSNQLVRDACRAIRRDSAWLAESHRNASSGAIGSVDDRYELRELHNGPLSTSALLDKRTGKIWVWKEMTMNGKKTGSTEFASETVTPEPEGTEGR